MAGTFQGGGRQLRSQLIYRQKMLKKFSKLANNSITNTRSGRFKPVILDNNSSENNQDREDSEIKSQEHIIELNIKEFTKEMEEDEYPREKAGENQAKPEAKSSKVAKSRKAGAADAVLGSMKSSSKLISTR